MDEMKTLSTLTKEMLIEKYLAKKPRFSESGELYQSGTRDMEARWVLYDMEVKDKTILDIGCNVGGFSGYCFGAHCKSYHGIELDPESVKLARSLFHLPNSTFEIGSVIPMSIETKYDVVFSFAVWYYTGVPFVDYLAKLYSLLAQDGTLYFESHGNEDFEKTRHLFEKFFEVIRVIKSPTVSNGVRSDDRYFAELRKK